MIEQPTVSSPAALRGLEGKVVMVTGAARGQGAYHALAFAAAGAKVAALDVPKPIDVSYGTAVTEELDGTVDRIRAAGGDALAVRADLRYEDSVEEAVRETVAAYGRIDVLVNNAGVAGWDPLPQMRPEVLDFVVDTNVKGTIYVTKFVAREMIAQGSGKIINITSAVIKSGTANMSHYVATKHAIVGLTEAWANELAQHGINVNAIAPGPIDPGTDDNPNGMSRGLADGAGASSYGEFFEAVSSSTNVEGAMWRIKMEDITDAVLFLSSDNARMITGHCLHVDAGQAVK